MRTVQLQRIAFRIRDCSTFILLVAEKEEPMPASLCGDDGSDAPTLSSPRQRNALLEDSAAKISIHQTRFHFM